MITRWPQTLLALHLQSLQRVSLVLDKSLVPTHGNAVLVEIMRTVLILISVPVAIPAVPVRSHALYHVFAQAI